MLVASATRDTRTEKIEAFNRRPILRFGTPNYSRPELACPATGGFGGSEVLM
jgi:hypothetical protein